MKECKYCGEVLEESKAKGRKNHLNCLLRHHREEAEKKQAKLPKKNVFKNLGISD